MKKLTLLLFLLFLVRISLEAVGVRPPDYYFTHITGENGLSQSNVKAILQDSYGFVWFGTKNGLNRYDGTSIVQKDCNDYVAGTGNHNISSLFEDADRQLWVGTDRGVYRYDPALDVFTVMNLETADGVSMYNWVAQITADRAGNIWIVIPDQGVFRYTSTDGGTLSFYKITDRNNIKTEAPQCIHVRPDGEVWVGTLGVGLFRYDPVADRFVQHAVSDRDANSLLGKNINAICESGNGWMALAIHEGEVMKYRPATDSLAKINLPGIDNSFVRTLISVDGELWIGTHDGLFVHNEAQGQTTHLQPDLMRSFSLSDSHIYTLYPDRTGGIWIGTMFGGVNYLSSHNPLFSKYMPGSDDYSLSSKRIREIAADTEGNLWIGTEEAGFNRLDLVTGKVSRAGHSYIRPAGHLSTLAMYTHGDYVYCGLFKQGLEVLHVPTGSVTYYSPERLGIDEGSVYSFHIDRRGYRWIGTGWGLYRAAPGTMNFTMVSAAGYDWIFDIFEDRDGIIWFASMGTGVMKCDPADSSFTRYSYEEGKMNGLSSNSISSIMQDSNGRIWISTDRGGICRYNPGTDNFTTFTISDGLPDDVAYKILEDERGNLWFGTNKGLVRFNPDSKYIQVYTTRDGLPGNQFNYKSAVKARDGKFYFGGIEGMIAFDPNAPDPPASSASVYITRLSIYNEEITVHTPNSPLQWSITHTNSITLPHNRANLSFDVALLNYSTAEANQYYYRMEPLDNDWIKAADNRNISYAKLLPGHYVFHVQAGGGPGSAVTTRSLEIVILPPWWCSVWAYIIYIVCAVCLVVLCILWYHRRKERQMEERQRLFEVEKEKELYESKVDFFTEIAHEIRTPLTLINGPLETIREMEITDRRLDRNLSVIEQNTHRLLDLAGQLLDFRKIDARKFDMKYESVDITSLLSETVGCFEPTIIRKKEIIRRIPDESIMAAVDREAITKILSNLLNNALKYARHTIWVELLKDETSFTVRVVSDGEKIAAAAGELIFTPFYQAGRNPELRQGVGIGLPLALSLALLHNGSLRLDNGGDENNTFVLTIPLNREGVQQAMEKTVDANVVVLDEETSLETGRTAGYTILLVEDNREMLTFIGERLERQFTVETAANGKEALDVLRASHVDLVVSDIRMPVMNGYELCRQMKADIDLSHIPLIFLTAKNDLESKINGLKIGAEAYVEKPFSYDFLKTQILSLLSNRRKEREAFSKRPFFPMNNMQMNRADEEFMNNAIRLIQENITDDNFTVERMADALCMSRSSLLRKIKSLFNLSPIDFIRLIRLRKAAELIQEGNYRIGDICYKVGINSPSYFSKLFLRQFGMTPKEFEKQNQERKSGSPFSIS